MQIWICWVGFTIAVERRELDKSGIIIHIDIARTLAEASFVINCSQRKATRQTFAISIGLVERRIAELLPGIR